MTGKHTYNSSWSADEIHDYIEGSMSAKEIVQFETDMQSDPFLKDAVEGYKGHAKLYVAHHLQRLNKEFQGQKSRVIIPMWAIGSVAASLLLAAAGWFLLTRESSNLPQLADQDVSSSVETTPTARQEQSALSHEILSDSFDNMSVNSDSESSDVMRSTQAEEEKRPAVVRQRKRRPQPKVGGVVSGTVIDDDGKPLIGANVYFPINEAAITTDFNGNFAVELKAYDSLAIVNYTGFESGLFRVEAGQKQQFQLTEGAELSDVAILNSKAQRVTTDETENALPSTASFDAAALEDKVQSESPVRATPEKGFKKFERYIKRNLNYPLDARNENIEGEVIIQFKVLPSGEYFDIRFIKSLGYGCDEEVMRLIKQGPQWISEIDDRIGQATYTVQFRKE